MIFVADRDAFIANAHHVAAISLFVFVFFNVCLNAVQRYLARAAVEASPRRFNRYALIAAVMLTDAILHVILWLSDWSHWVLTIEASLIALFAIFWAVQTAERWEDGITPLPGTAFGAPSSRPETATVGQA